MVVAALGFGGYSLWPLSESPREAWAEITSTAERGDYPAEWDHIHPDTQARLLGSVREYAKLKEPDRAAVMTDRDAYALFLAKFSVPRATDDRSGMVGV